TGFPPTGFPPTGFPPTGFPPTGFPPTGFPPTGFPPTGFAPTGLRGDLAPRGFPAERLGSFTPGGLGRPTAPLAGFALVEGAAGLGASGGGLGGVRRGPSPLGGAMGALGRRGFAPVESSSLPASANPTSVGCRRRDERLRRGLAFAASRSSGSSLGSSAMVSAPSGAPAS
ncbi:MAG: hypothetical protein AB8I08_40670, partial [Sandaracinaceae bacterium]